MPIKPHFIIYTILCLFITASCTSVKNLVSKDLEEEDFIIGKLYEDELVKETPYIPPTVKPNAPGETITKDKAFEEVRKGGKNAQLYEAIAPWIGVPYKYGGTTKQGVDCSAFVGHIYKDAFGVTLHRVARDIQKDVQLIGKNQLREGDILFFVNSNNKVSHVGIYLHDDMFVHASTSNGVSISSLNNSYWKKHFFRGGKRK
ncbi:MAG: C40 family peptidase [Bacteroidales bacterium]|nr:C40 family peptidase [Bacteroidales bacterium]